MDSYPAHRLLTGREIARHRLRGLHASKEHQKQAKRSSENLSSVLRRFDLNGDGEITTKEFVQRMNVALSDMRSMNATCALRSMNATLSDHDIRAVVQAVDADGNGSVFSCQRLQDHGNLLAGEDNTEPCGSWPGAHAEEVRRHEKRRYLRGLLKQFEHDGAVDAPQFAEAMRALNSHLTPREVDQITREACGETGSVHSAAFVEASTRDQLAAFLLSKRHRDNGAILAWPEPEPEPAPAPLRDARTTPRATPAGWRGGAEPGSDRVFLRLGGGAAWCGYDAARGAATPCGSGGGGGAAAAVVEVAAAAAASAAHEVEKGQATRRARREAAAAAEQVALGSTPRTSCCTPARPSHAKPGSLKAAAADRAAGATSGCVSKHQFVFEAGREPLRCSPRISQPASSRRVATWQDVTGVMPLPTPGSSSLVLRLCAPPPPPAPHAA